MVVFGAAPSSAQSCDLIVEEGQRDAASAAASVVFPPENGYSDQWTLANASDFQAPHSYFDARPSQWYWFAATLVFLFVWSPYLRLRRRETALYAIAGLKTIELSVLINAELVILGVTVAIVSATVVWLALLLHPLPFADVGVGIIAATRYLLAAILASLVIGVHVAYMSGTSTLARLQDR